MIGVGFDWGYPYDCEGWANTFGLEYPIIDDDDSLSIVNGFGVNYIPYNVVIDHNMIVRYSTFGWNEELLTATIGTYLSLLPTVDVDESESSPSQVLPERFTLHAPYPNPFNPSTTVSFDLHVDSEIELIVNDLLGRRIEVLAEGLHRKGSYQLEWKANNGSGIYFVTLKTEFGVRTEKVVLIR